ncbi:MAG: DUF58 domain-containing protein, partial [Duncaniella sp.]|nr:DUF58 domain-containing protein [Duncaniella sp.]
MRVEDLETGQLRWIDTSSKKVRNAFGKWWYGLQQNMTETMRRSRVDLASIATDEDFAKALMQLFRKRGLR